MVEIADLLHCHLLDCDLRHPENRKAIYRADRVD